LSLPACSGDTSHPCLVCSLLHASLSLTHSLLLMPSSPPPLQVLYPAICLKNAEVVVNFGDTPFKFPPPEGFVGLSKAPPDVTVSAAAAATAATAGSSSERRPLCLVLEPSRWVQGLSAVCVVCVCVCVCVWCACVVVHVHVCHGAWSNRDG